MFRSRISEQIRFPQSYYDTTPSCKDYCITSRIFLFISRESRVSHDNKFSLTTASRSLTGCQGYNNTKKAELLDGKIDAKRSRVLSVGRERASLQDSRVKIVFRCWKSWLEEIFSCFLLERAFPKEILEFQYCSIATKPLESDTRDLDGRNGSETMVQRYDKRSIVQNAIDPRQSVTVTRDALRNPTQSHVWLGTNTRVKINADTRTGRSST